MIHCKNILRSLLVIVLIPQVSSCDIKDDIPYPTLESVVTAFSVEGQCDENGASGGASVIDGSRKEVTLYVDDTVDLSRLLVTKMEVSNDATIVPDEKASAGFPSSSFSQPTENSRIDLKEGATFTLRTYQDYLWKIKATQVIKREVEVEGQIGNAVVDPDSRNVVIYVSPKVDLKALKVSKFSLGGQHGSVDPDPTASPTYDFSVRRDFYVKEAWSESIYKWRVFVYETAEQIQPSASASTDAKGSTIISGRRPNGVMPRVRYKEATAADWISIPDLLVQLPTSTTYQVELSALRSDVKYLYTVSFDDLTLEQQSFYFIGEQLQAADFDAWSHSGKVYQPWAEGGSPYWDTGNKGATTVGDSNSTPSDDTPSGSGLSANLLSKYIVIKFAAGNIFTGTYLETDGTNGILGWGRPFSSRPSRMTFDYKYRTAKINKIGDSSLDYLKGRNDTCCVYIVLADWEPEVYDGRVNEYKGKSYPFIAKTRPSERHLIDPKNDPNIIAYGQLSRGDDVTSWTKGTVKLEYYSDRTPKWILVVATSSKFGDYFTGGDGALLNVDNFKLTYE